MLWESFKKVIIILGLSSYFVYNDGLSIVRDTVDDVGNSFVISPLKLEFFKSVCNIWVYADTCRLSFKNDVFFRFCEMEKKTVK
jgi:hypothetical protein